MASFRFIPISTRLDEICWPQWVGERARKRRGGKEFAMSANRPTSDFAERISFRFFWPPGGCMVLPYRKGGNMSVQSKDSRIQSGCNHNQPQFVCVCVRVRARVCVWCIRFPLPWLCGLQFIISSDFLIAALHKYLLHCVCHLEGSARCWICAEIIVRAQMCRGPCWNNLDSYYCVLGKQLFAHCQSLISLQRGLSAGAPFQFQPHLIWFYVIISP